MRRELVNQGVRDFETLGWDDGMVLDDDRRSD